MSETTDPIEVELHNLVERCIGRARECATSHIMRHQVLQLLEEDEDDDNDERKVHPKAPPASHFNSLKKAAHSLKEDKPELATAILEVTRSIEAALNVILDEPTGENVPDFNQIMQDALIQASHVPRGINVWFYENPTHVEEEEETDPTKPERLSQVELSVHRYALRLIEELKELYERGIRTGLQTENFDIFIEFLEATAQSTIKREKRQRLVHAFSRFERQFTYLVENLADFDEEEFQTEIQELTLNANILLESAKVIPHNRLPRIVCP